MVELWKDVPGYEGKYQISNLGRVKSLPRPFVEKERFLVGNVGIYGYHRVLLRNPKRLFPVHVLVAKAFIPNPENKPQVNHKDGVKTNNHIDNLEWCTVSENNQHRYDTGLAGRGEKAYQAKLKDQDIPEIFSLRKQQKSYSEIGNIFGVSKYVIYQILKRNCWKHIVIPSLFLLFPLSTKAQSNTDSVKCYTTTELRKIAVTILKEKECARILDITTKQLTNRMEVVADQDIQLKLLNKTITHLDTIIANKESQLEETTKLLKKETRKKKFWRWCAQSVTVVAGVVIVVLAIR